MKRACIHRLRHALISGLAASALLMQGCAPGEAAPAKPNIVVILVDTLRADHLGCYGYARNTSPHIDKLAQEGVLFENAYTASTFTGEAVAALFTGVWPMQNPQGVGWNARPDANRVVWPELFRAEGYATAHLANSPLMNTEGFNTGFDQFSCLAENFGISGAGPQLTRKALEFVEQNADKPLCMYIHYMDPHSPYDPPGHLYRKFSEKAMEDPAHHVEDVMGNIASLRKEGFGPGDPRFENQVLRYDAEIAATDEQVGALMKGLEEAGELDNTIVVLLADHGEEFLEHGFMDHAWTLYNETLQVPLIVRWPSRLRPERIADNVSTVAVLPTLLHLAGAKALREDYSLAPLFTQESGEWRCSPGAGPLFAELQIETRSMVRAVIHESYKYLAGARWLDEACTQALFRVQKPLRASLLSNEWQPLNPRTAPMREALFDLKADPGETIDILAQAPEKAAELRTVLEKALAAAPPTKGLFTYRDSDPLPQLLQQLEKDPAAVGGESPMSAEQQAELEALGYMGGSGQSELHAPCLLQ